MTGRRCGRILVLGWVVLGVTIVWFGTRNEWFVLVRMVRSSISSRTLETAKNKTVHNKPTATTATATTTMDSNPIVFSSNHDNSMHRNSPTNPLFKSSHHHHHHPTPLCTREEIQTGEWIPLTLPKAPYIPNNIKLRCYPIEAYHQPWRTWQWQPHAQTSGNCTLTPWNSDYFCKWVKHTTVAIVGDSLSWEHYASLMQLLGLKSHQTYQHRSKQLNQNHVEYACHKTVRLVYRRDDLLEKVQDVIDSVFPQVLVLNRGAHFTNDTTLKKGIQQVLQELIPWQTKCQTLQVACHLIWRTSVPGHPSCWNFTKPVTSIAEMEAYIRNPQNYDHLERQWKYHWYDYQHQNELALEAWTHHAATTLSHQQRPSRYVSFDIMDAYYINLLRPDEHRWHHNQSDCLHSCYPGKMDLYNQLLLHYLARRGGVAMKAGNIHANWTTRNTREVTF